MEFSEKIFQIQTEADFNRVALEIFRRQFDENLVYQRFAERFCKAPSELKNYKEIPFLPIDFFKSKKVVCGNNEPAAIFRSSGTSGSVTSMHHVSDLKVYEQSAVRSFEMNFGPVKEFTFIALLPSYLERNDSSLVWMANHFISKSNYKEDCGFFLGHESLLLKRLEVLSRLPERKVILIGVSFALLDLAEKIDIPLNHVVIMETGGMKGRRREIIRGELHKILCEKMQVPVIYSEYGMTEMLSQAYTRGNGIYVPPPWLKIMVREMNDPFSFVHPGRTGGINIIDLANMNSCSFIATQDLGKVYDDGSFEVLGRFDNSDIRGCNLMADNL